MELGDKAGGFFPTDWNNPFSCIWFTKQKQQHTLWRKKLDPDVD